MTLLSRMSRRPITLFLMLYVLVGVIGWLADRFLPGDLARGLDALTANRGLGVMDPGEFPRAAAPAAAPLWSISVVGMAAAGLLSAPVAWLYTLTRQKRGYRQSVVHSLILLPVVVAGVVVLVKHSLALAFSLAGIVAAVRFRNTLEDSKDAVYIFVATSIGLAAGVELTSAAALSVVFNLVTILLFRSDFGRTPARLEGDMADQRMRRALEEANRTSQFVARVDQEILGHMAPEQLEALADRAWARRKQSEDDDAPRDAVVRLRTDGSATSREAVEAELNRHAKRWNLEASAPAPDGGQWFEYAVRLRKSSQPTALMDAMTAEPTVLEVDIK